MSVETLKDLFIDNLRDLYNAEAQQVKNLAKMAKAASRPDLKKAIEMHGAQTRGQMQKLEQVFKQLGMKAQGKKCVGMEGLAEEGKEILEEAKDPAVKDAGIIVALQKAEHYEIASYGAVRTFAEQLGMGQAARILDRILAEEKKSDELLNKLAMKGGINMQAKKGESAAKGAKKSASSSKSKSSGAKKSMSGGSSKSKSSSSKSTSSASRSAKPTGAAKSAGASASRAKSASSRKSAASAAKPRSTAKPRSKSSAASQARGGTSQSSSNVTTDHEQIRQWVEQRGGKPACVRGTGDSGDTGLLRIDFPGYSGGDTLQEISWDEFFEKFDEQKLAFLYQDTTADGKESRFLKLVSREGNE